jgi:hypothetical protein
VILHWLSFEKNNRKKAKQSIFARIVQLILLPTPFDCIQIPCKPISVINPVANPVANFENQVVLLKAAAD